jgi:hypothetical protein
MTQQHVFWPCLALHRTYHLLFAMLDREVDELRAIRELREQHEARLKQLASVSEWEEYQQEIQLMSIQSDALQDVLYAVWRDHREKLGLACVDEEGLITLAQSVAKGFHSLYSQLKNQP